MKKTATVLLALVVMFSMSACDRDANGNLKLTEKDFVLEDGRTIHCAGYGDSLSCDWENAK